MGNKHLSLWVSAVLVAGLTVGCRDHDAIYDTDADFSTPEHVSLPTNLSMSYQDRGILVAQNAEPDPKRLEELRVTALDRQTPIGKFDLAETATIKGVLPGMLLVVKNKQWADVSKCFVPKQGQEIGRFLKVLTPTIEKSTALTEAMPKPEDGTQPAMAMPGMPTDPNAMIAMLQPLLMMASVKGADSRHAVVEIASPMGGQEPLQVPFKKVGKEWKIEIPEQFWPPQPLLDQLYSTLEADLPSFNQKMDQVTAGLKDGSMTPEAAQVQLTQASMAIGQKVSAILAPFIMQVSGANAAGSPPPTAPQAPPSVENASDAEAAIRQLLEQQNAAWKARKLDDLASLYSPTVKAATQAEFQMWMTADKIAQTANLPPDHTIRQISMALENASLVSADKVDENTYKINIKIGEMPQSPMLVKRIDQKWYFAGEESDTEQSLAQQVAIYADTQTKLEALLREIEEGRPQPSEVATRLQQILTEMEMRRSQLKEPNTSPPPPGG